jgi:hypothetical protein
MHRSDIRELSQAEPTSALIYTDRKSDEAGDDLALMRVVKNRIGTKNPSI